MLGTSSLLFTLLFAGSATLWGVDFIPQYASFLSAAADGVAIWLLSRLALALGLPTPSAALANLLQALAPLSIRYASGGMETSLVTAVILGALTAHIRRSDTVAAHLAGVSGLLRPDGLAMGAVIRKSLAWEKRRVPWKSMAIMAAWVVPVAFLLLARSGSPVPHSIVAKSSPIYRATPLTNGLQFLYHFDGLFVGAAQRLPAKGLVIPPDAQLITLYGLLVVAQLPLWLKGANLAARADARWSAAIAYPVLYAGVYTAAGLRGSLIAEWYVVPLLSSGFFSSPMACVGRWMAFDPGCAGRLHASRALRWSHACLAG